MKTRFASLYVVLIAAIVMASCTKPYTITQPLEEPVAQPAGIRVGNITDNLPMEMADEKKPTIDDITNFREAIEAELENSELFQLADTGQSYEVRGSIMEYKRGSGFMRFMIGFGAGNAKVLTHLELVNIKSNRVIFGGDFSGMVSSWGESGAAMYKRVAKDFAKQIKKQSNEMSPSGQ